MTQMIRIKKDRRKIIFNHFFLRHQRSILLSYFLFPISYFSCSQNACTIKNDVFQVGEEMTYKAYYNWGFLWLEAGEATLKVNSGEYAGKKVFHLTGIGGSYPKYDWIYRVRDRFEAHIDTASLLPYHFLRDVNEGSRILYEEDLFNYRNKKIYSLVNKRKLAIKADTINLPDCIHDVLSAIYYTRCIDFSKYKENEIIPFTLFLENEISPIYIRYQGKAVFESKETGRVNCIKIKPKLLEGTIFKDGENMTVYLSDDKNKLPVFIEADIVIGSMKVYLIGTKNLKN